MTHKRFNCRYSARLDNTLDNWWYTKYPFQVVCRMVPQHGNPLSLQWWLQVQEKHHRNSEFGDNSPNGNWRYNNHQFLVDYCKEVFRGRIRKDRLLLL